MSRTLTPPEEYQGWKYTHDMESGYHVEPSENIETPKTFYKFYALSENSVDALVHGYLYVTHPNQFNDAFDCDEGLLDFQETDEKTLQCLYEPLYGKFSECHGGLEGLRHVSPQHFKTLFYKHVGLVAFASRKDNPALWAYYAQNTGFCLEFDPTKFPFRHYGPFPVQYVDELQPFQVHKNLPTASFIQMNVKQKVWEREQEWRLIVSNPEGEDFATFDRVGNEVYHLGNEHNRKMLYPFSALRSITLAERFLKDKQIALSEVTPLEYDVRLLDDHDVLRKRVLDHLSLISAHIPTFITRIEKNHFTYTFHLIQVLKLLEGRYRLFTSL